MRAKPVVPRELAIRDVDEAIAYYLGEDAEQTALGFIDALEYAYAVPPAATPSAVRRPERQKAVELNSTAFVLVPRRRLELPQCCHR